MSESQPEATYCERWDPQRRTIDRPLPAEIARARHGSGEPYAVLIGDPDRPQVLLEVSKHQAELAAWSLDEQQRRTSLFEFRMFGSGWMPLTRVAEWQYADAARPEFDPTAPRRLTTFGRGGEPVVKSLDAEGAVFREITSWDRGFGEPAFGDWSGLVDFVLDKRSRVPAGTAGRRWAAAPSASPADGGAVALRDALWAELGTVDDDVISHFLSPTFFGGPVWPTTRQAFLRVRRSASVVLASDGLSDPYDDQHLAEPGRSGLGVEVFLETDDPTLRADGISTITESWAFELLYEMAQNAAYTADLADRIDRLGVVSMELPGLAVGAGWQTVDGSVGLLMGVPAPEIRPCIDTPTGSVRLVAVTLLRPAELDHVVTGRAAARADVAQRLAASGHHHRCDLSRPSVI